MKAVNIKWDIDEDYKADDLPTEVAIPNEVLEISSGVVLSSQEIYETRIEQISNYLSDEYGFCHKGFDIELERKDVVQYALDAGTGINYYDGETTDKEINSCGENVRYVDSVTVDSFFDNDNKNLQYAIVSGMCLLDYDEWQAIKEVFNADLSYDDASDIICTLWEYYDRSPLDIPDTENAKTVKEAVGIEDLSLKDEKFINDILQKYDCSYEMSSEKEKE